MRPIQIDSHVELTIEQKEKIEKVFRAKHPDTQLQFIYTVHPKLVGGVRIIDNGFYYDASVKTILDRFSRGEGSGRETEDALSANSDANQRKDGKSSSQALKDVDGGLFAQNRFEFDVSKSGTVTYCGDGIIKINGLRDVQNNELLMIENGSRAIALNLEKDEIGAIILDNDTDVSTGMVVRPTGNIVQVPVGDGMLGRVVGSFGQPLDGLGAIKATKYRAVESPAPTIMERAKVNRPLQTGILAIDSMIPIGKGQRELIIGDRQTGKTAIAVDTILNQKGKDIICIYVSIGQKASSINNILHVLKESGAMEYTCIVCSTAKDSAPLQYLCPYSGCAIAEDFMHRGKDVLIVYDDLSKHAVAYRTISLLLKRPPGREAYPGDIFYLHSRLLERAAHLAPELGSGSMTALPIVETLAGDISAYIPTNVISITDGQIYLEQELFNAGIRPAVNVGLSVSRVGSSAQVKCMKKVSGKLRLDLSQYRELAIFAQFGSELDASTQAMLAKGERTTETLKQQQYTPYDVTSQVILLYVANKEFLRDVPVKRIQEFNKGFLSFIEVSYPQIRKAIDETQDLSTETCVAIEDAVKAFAEYYEESKR